MKVQTEPIESGRGMHAAYAAWYRGFEYEKPLRALWGDSLGSRVPFPGSSLGPENEGGDVSGYGEYHGPSEKVVPLRLPRRVGVFIALILRKSLLGPFAHQATPCRLGTTVSWSE